MQLAFVLYKYFPFGGLQRDFMRIALECQKRGHQIRVYTLIWEGDIPPGFEVLVAPVKALFNHRRNEKLSAWMEEHEYESVTQMRGSMSQQYVPEPAMFERANYMKVLQSWRPDLAGQSYRSQ